LGLILLQQGVTQKQQQQPWANQLFVIFRNNSNEFWDF
jgi:hypothetical protein